LLGSNAINFKGIDDEQKNKEIMYGFNLSDIQLVGMPGNSMCEIEFTNRNLFQFNSTNNTLIQTSPY
jgi:hypothetical protein